MNVDTPALCCSVLQCVAVRCSVLKRVAVCRYVGVVCCGVFQCAAVVLQCVAVCCIVLQHVAILLQCDAVVYCLPTGEYVVWNSIWMCAHLYPKCLVLQCVAVYRCFLQCVVMCSMRCCTLQLYCSVLQMYCGVLQYVAVCCNVLQFVAILLQYDAVVYCLPTGEYVVWSNIWMCARLHPNRLELQCVAAFCSVLQGVAVCCNVLQCVAVRCSALQLYCSCTAVCCSVLQCVAILLVWCSDLLLVCRMK